MAPVEQWQQVQELFHAALEREPDERSLFLDEACNGNEALRQKVGWLVSAHETEDHFIDAPGYVAAQEVLATHHFEPGEMLAHYRIQSTLGEGGMGVVYLAEDTRLKRSVALKVLPPHFTVNPDRVRRFEREARAASALNHPNIVTIYEIGQANSTHFIATEFVDGKTLRQLINEKPFTLNEILNVSMQVADALSGAHAAGIIHRDIKPENIMIRHDGYVKILDFGLAKLTEQQTDASDLETPTLLLSNPGLVMGTVHYMSPEQARARHVGVGTDIWSLGIVMYELVSGHVPFTGETPSHVMVSLMEDKLPSLKNRANVPAELDGFVTKALRKNQKDRFQTAGQLARDLNHFKQTLQQDPRLKEWLRLIPSRHKAPTGLTGAQASRLHIAAATETVAFQSHVKAPATGTIPPQSRPTSSAEYLVREIKTHRTLALAASVLVIFTAVGLTYFFKKRADSRAALQSVTSTSASANPTQKRGTMSDEAYRAYLQGRNLMNQRTADADKKAIEYFEQAIRLDPNYAHPYAGLAYAYFGYSGIGGGSPRIEMEKAVRALEKALELDGNLAEAYAVRGMINHAYEWDYAAAEKDLTKAIDLEPTNDTAHWGYSLLCANAGRFEQALKEMETAQAIAPGTDRYERDRGRILYYARRYDEAIVQLKRNLELRRGGGGIWLSRAYEIKGDYLAAFEAFMTTVNDPQRSEAYRLAYENAGWQTVKRKFLEFSLLDEQTGKRVNNYQIAIAFAQLGEKDRAFAYLNKLVEERSWQVTTLNVDPQVDPLRGDPRFTELLKVIRR